MSISDPAQDIENVVNEDAPSVERDGLTLYEVTWENGTVEQIAAHYLIRDRTKATHLHFILHGGITLVSARDDRIRMIRNLDQLGSLPDLDLDPVAEAPAQVSEQLQDGE